MTKTKSILIVFLALLVGGGLMWAYAESNTVLGQKLSACESIPNGTTLDVRETGRMFVNLPEDIYPYSNREFVSNGATMGAVSNGQGLGPSDSSKVDAWKANHCEGRYYEFGGAGNVDMKVKSAMPGFPDYTVYFRVTGV